jgi:hypothetical protein
MELMGDGEKNNALRSAGFVAVAAALWNSVDEIHPDNLARLGKPVTADISTIPSVGQRRNQS